MDRQRGENQEEFLWSNERTLKVEEIMVYDECPSSLFLIITSMGSIWYCRYILLSIF